MEDTNQIIVPLNGKKTNWQNLLIMAALALLFLILFYFFYKFVSHTNKKFKMVENAINQMNDRLKQQPIHQPQPQHPLPQVPQVPANPFPHLFMASAHQPQPSHLHSQQKVQQPVVRQPPPSVQVVDVKILEKELMEELQELDASTAKKESSLVEQEKEGRVDVDVEVMEDVTSTTTSTTTSETLSSEE